jgi:hypothetical protein
MKRRQGVDESRGSMQFTRILEPLFKFERLNPWIPLRGFKEEALKFKN